MVNKLEDLDFTGQITVKELLLVLKKEASDISVTDIMTAHSYLVAEGKYVQGNYRKEYLQAYVKGFILRLKEIKNNQNKFEGTVNACELKEAVELLNEQEQALIKIRSRESHFFKIYKIISIYTTFILDEPIHIVGTPFPGGFKVKYENGTYFCPVKDKQKDNPGAVCGFCIAEQDEDM
ncbi:MULTISPECIES: DUF2115 domain-containing protein [Methanobacterium]|uniref:UPF0305 protein O3H35_14880 n=1 Tax=Methanobacterium veterum TaxID=408577 RepID=A0A9E4ZX26_9EURY|nr:MULTISPECIES: DUF2115 domain-containing protein [Methanobacterium]MCZ3366919.1 DUF2115 domain-containing protein [Methanobacterium veterum]MCZ3373934.1 DUF2115 domain-containing protein [Methanobacterium veterum]